MDYTDRYVSETRHNATESLPLTFKMPLRNGLPIVSNYDGSVAIYSMDVGDHILHYNHGSTEIKIVKITILQ